MILLLALLLTVTPHVAAVNPETGDAPVRVCLRLDADSKGAAELRLEGDTFMSASTWWADARAPRLTCRAFRLPRGEYEVTGRLRASWGGRVLQSARTTAIVVGERWDERRDGK